MGRFHDRMDDDLRIRGYSANTRECYLRCVRNFVRHFMRPPDQLTPEHIRGPPGGDRCRSVLMLPTLPIDPVRVAVSGVPLLAASARVEASTAGFYLPLSSNHLSVSLRRRCRRARRWPLA